jgi:hypothetical protein
MLTREQVLELVHDWRGEKINLVGFGPGENFGQPFDYCHPRDRERINQLLETGSKMAAALEEIACR